MVDHLSHDSNPIETLRYPLGFLIGADAEGIADHFRPIEFPVPLAVHPKTQIAVARNDGEPLAILGEAVHPDLPHLDLQGIANHLHRNTGTRQAEVDKLVGRFALIQSRTGGDLAIQTDAIGMRTVYYSLSDSGVIAGSHAKLVAGARPGGEKRKDRPYRWGYPGITTPYSSVFRLPPNCELSLGKGILQRFFPISVLPETGIEDAWDLAFDRAGTTIEALAKRRNLLLSLSAGLDSRTSLAACRNLWPEIKFFTYHGQPKNEIDARIAPVLAKSLGLQHVFVHDSRDVSNTEVLKIISANTFTTHKRRLAGAYHSCFGEHFYLHIRSNLLEIARSNLFRRFGKRPRFRDGPSSAQSMTDVYRVSAGLKPENSAHVLPAFEHNIAATDYESTIGKASPWDLYFVEHRMGAWHAGVLLESDVSFDTVIAFNSREVVSHFMGVPEEVRCSSPHLAERLQMLLPEIKHIPVNPKRYP